MASIIKMSHSSVTAQFTQREWDLIKAALRDIGQRLPNLQPYAGDCVALLKSISPSPNPTLKHYRK